MSLRAALAYVEQSADPAKACATCQQYTEGSCKVLRGPVASAASCRAFVARPSPVVKPLPPIPRRPVFSANALRINKRLEAAFDHDYTALPPTPETPAQVRARVERELAARIMARLF